MPTRPSPRHDDLLGHPLVHSYVSLRIWGSLVRHIDVLAAELRARTAAHGRVFSFALRGAKQELALAELLADRVIVVAGTPVDRRDELRAEIDRCRLRNVEIAEGTRWEALHEAGSFDAVVGIYALHCITDLEDYWLACRRALRPGGVAVCQEYVGPNRLLWPEQQIAAVNRALADLVPPRHKPHHASVDHAVAESLVRAEPNLAARSAEITTACKGAGFEIPIRVGAGCALLHPALVGQISTYDPMDWSHNAILSRLFRAEAELMNQRVLGDDFAMFIAQPRP